MKMSWALMKKSSIKVAGGEASYSPDTLEE